MYLDTVYSTVFHRILDLKQGGISIRALFYFIYVPAESL
jgi:hypothetical protein